MILCANPESRVPCVFWLSDFWTMNDEWNLELGKGRSQPTVRLGKAAMQPYVNRWIRAF
jgi:hypothetical protein